MSPDRYSMPFNSRNGRWKAASAPTQQTAHPTMAARFIAVLLLVPILRAGFKPRRVLSVGELEPGQVRQLQNPRHFLEIDFLDGVGYLVVVRMESREPPHCRYIA